MIAFTFARRCFSLAEVFQLLQMITELRIVRAVRTDRWFRFHLGNDDRGGFGETLIVETTGRFFLKRRFIDEWNAFGRRRAFRSHGRSRSGTARR